MRELLLAIAHHLLVFGLAAILAVQLALVRRGLSLADLKVAGRLDALYGATAGLVLVAGFSRVLWGGKGAAFYVHNPVFWAKMAAFGAVALLSIIPTIQLLRWRAEVRRDPAALPADVEIGKLRAVLWAEAGVFAVIPVFAAAMARGVGL